MAQEKSELLVDWEVIPLELPTVSKNCSRCKTKRRFYCSEKFRINANRQYLDVWLIYRCMKCDFTWNLPIYERYAVQDIDSDLYEAMKANDRAVAWRYAFDLERLRKYVYQVNAELDYDIRRHAYNIDSALYRYCRIVIKLTFSCDIRLDKFLSRELKITRSKIKTMHNSGIIELNPCGTRALKKAIRNDQSIIIDMHRYLNESLDIKLLY